MYLCEEYMQRHSLKFPYAKLVNFGANFFKKSDVYWYLLTVSWKEPTRHPGNFIIKIMQPQHNGYEDNTLFHIVKDWVVHLDEYEDFFLDFANNFDGKFARDDEVYIAAWETYLYCYDFLLVKHAKMSELLATIDQDASVSDRLEAINQTMLKLYDSHPKLVEHWSLNMRKYTEHYNHWLPALVDFVHD